jgi:multiple sugar transport system permease protein
LRTSRRKKVRMVVKILTFVVIGIVFLVYIFPIFWMGITSLKTKVQIFDPTPKIAFKPTLSNYKVFFGFRKTGEVGAGERGGGSSKTFIRAFTNSVAITFASTLLALILGTMAGYVLSRYEMKAKNDLMFFILSTRMLPPIVALVPVSLLFTNIGLKDTFLGFVLLYTNFNLAFSVWIMKGFFDDVPFSFEEADGYPRFRAFLKVVLPMVTNGLAATAIFCGIMIWNEYIFAIVLGSKKWTLMPPTIFANSSGTTGIIWGVLAASSLLYVIPVIVFTYLIRKQLLRGVTFGVIRG